MRLFTIILLQYLISCEEYQLPVNFFRALAVLNLLSANFSQNSCCEVWYSLRTSLTKNKMNNSNALIYKDS